MARTLDKMIEVINTGGIVTFAGRRISKIENLPTDAEVAAFNKAQQNPINYNWMMSKFMGGNTSSGLPYVPKSPIIFLPAQDPVLAEKYPTLEELGLGRLPQLADPRDLLHPMESAITPDIVKELKEVRMRYWQTAGALDQDNTPQCVAYSRTQLLLSGPVKNTQFSSPAEFYHQCQLVDEWAGENYDGTSVRAMCKVLKSEGFISGYTWATDVETVIKHVLGVGPVVLGTNWYNSMFYPDAITGFIKIIGGTGIAGGHAYMLKGANRDKLCPDGSKGAFRVINSWGTGWGQDGMAFISFTDVARLIREYGEAAGVNELKFGTQAVSGK